jgi:hypothetical protein
MKSITMQHSIIKKLLVVCCEERKEIILHVVGMGRANSKEQANYLRGGCGAENLQVGWGRAMCAWAEGQNQPQKPVSATKSTTKTSFSYKINHKNQFQLQ